MSILRCPRCRRVFDGEECLACGYMPEPDDPLDDVLTVEPDGAVEDAFFADHSVDEASPAGAVEGEVIEDLSMGELLRSSALPVKLDVLCEMFANEGMHTESVILRKVRAIVENPQRFIIQDGQDSADLGEELVDGNEEIPDDTVVVEDLPLGELLRYKARLSTKVGYIADFATAEGRVEEGQILYQVRDLLKKLDAAKSYTDRSL